MNLQCYCPCIAHYTQKKTYFTNPADNPETETIYWVHRRCHREIDDIPHVCKKDSVAPGETVSVVWGYQNGVVDPNLSGVIVQRIPVIYPPTIEMGYEYIFLRASADEIITPRDMLSKGYVVSLDGLLGYI